MTLDYAGVLLAERYEVQEHLASGGMSVVYRAWDRVRGRPVAIKVLREGCQENVSDIARFCREARTMAALHSPHIVASYDFFEEHGNYFMVMELVEGVQLKNHILARGQLTAVEALLIAEQVCLALAEAHVHGFLHRDIKPQNILLDQSGNVRLADFGIVYVAAARGLTTDGMVLGTADYISPEQAQGLVLGPTTDIYSLGVVIFEMLTGVLPFTGTTPIAVAMQHATLPPPSLRSLAPATPRVVERVVRRALAKKPEQRYQSAQELAAVLHQVREELQLAEEKATKPGTHLTDQALATIAQVRQSLTPRKTHRRTDDKSIKGNMSNNSIMSKLLFRHSGAADAFMPEETIDRHHDVETIDYTAGEGIAVVEDDSMDDINNTDNIDNIGSVVNMSTIADVSANGALMLTPYQSHRSLLLAALPMMLLLCLLAVFSLSIVFLSLMR